MSTREVCKVMKNVANMIFQQDWVLAEEKTADDEIEDGEDCASSSDDDEETETDTDKPADLTYTFPSRRSIMRYLEDASLLSLKYVADKIFEDGDSSVITVGLDDTTKAAGHCMYDVRHSS